MIDDAFFQLDWAGACWGRWAGNKAVVDWSEGSGSSGRRLDCCWADLQTLDVALLCKKNKKEEGTVGASPIAAPMPKSVSF